MTARATRLHLLHLPCDKRFTSRLARDLRARGRDVWFAEWDVLGSICCWDALLAYVPDRSWFGVVLSETSLLQAWLSSPPLPRVREEFSVRGIYRLPILTDDCDLPAALANIVHADFRSEYESGIETVMSCLEASVPTAERANALGQLPALADEGQLRVRAYFEYLLRQRDGDINQAALVAGMESGDFHLAMRRAGVDPQKFRR